MDMFPSGSKREVVSRLAALVGIAEANLGPGGKERKQLIEDVAGYLGLGVDLAQSKPALLRSVIEELGGRWEARFASRGDTLQVSGLDELLRLSLMRRPIRGRDLIESNAGPAAEAQRIVDVCLPLLTRPLTIKRTVELMKGSDYRQWAQQEWHAFYLEYRLKQRCLASIGGTEGRHLGRTRLDYEFLRPWDFKAHTIESGSRAWTPLNDRAAMEQCAKELGGIGFVVVSGHASYDDTGEARVWLERMREDANKTRRRPDQVVRPRRRIKSAFVPRRIDALWLSRAELRRGLRLGWLAPFNQGRQASGGQRNPKLKIDLTALPASVRVADAEVG
jgi:hypothetical protein